MFEVTYDLAAMLIVAAVVAIPFGLPRAHEAMNPEGLAMMLGLALLVPLLPYALEMTALRRMPMSAFGILMSLEPAAAALAGLVVLGEVLRPIELLAMGCVIVASIGSTRANRRPSEPPAPG